MKRILLPLMTILGLLGFSSNAYAYSLTGRTGVGIGYLYASIKHGFSPKYSLEGMISDISGNTGIGGRIYYYLTPIQKRMVWYMGGGAYLYGKKDKGINLGIAGFGGGEYFLEENVTIGGDLGPLLADSINLALKFGFYCYF